MFRRGGHSVAYTLDNFKMIHTSLPDGSELVEEYDPGTHRIQGVRHCMGHGWHSTAQCSAVQWCDMVWYVVVCGVEPATPHGMVLPVMHACEVRKRRRPGATGAPGSWEVLLGEPQLPSNATSSLLMQESSANVGGAEAAAPRTQLSLTCCVWGAEPRQLPS